MSTPRRRIVRRSIPALRLWPGDEVRIAEDGTVQLVRTLPEGAPAVLEAAERRGDLGGPDDAA